MKSIKKISLLIIILIVSVVYFNENIIATYAEEYSTGFIKVGEIYKSGDVINILEVDNFIDVNGNNWCSGSDGLKDRCSILHIVNYYDSDNKWLLEQYSENNKFVFEQYKNKDVFWKVTYMLKEGGYLHARFNVMLIDYAEPTLSFSCADEKLDATKSTTCDLILNYNYDAKNLDFKLNIDENLFDVNEVKGQNDWKVTNTNNDYSLSYTKETSSDKKELTEVKIATIKLTAKEVEKSTDLKDNIVVNGVKYTDVMTSRSMDKALETINVNKFEKKEEPKQEVVEEPQIEEKTEEVVEVQEEIENPPTGVKSIISYVLIGSIIGFILIKISKKYKLFS